jgi:hypothetical protein
MADTYDEHGAGKVTPGMPSMPTTSGQEAPSHTPVVHGTYEPNDDVGIIE